MTFDLSGEMERRIVDADASISRVLARRVAAPAADAPVHLTRTDLAAIASLDPAEQDTFVTALLDMGRTANEAGYSPGDKVQTRLGPATVHGTYPDGYTVRYDHCLHCKGSGRDSDEPEYRCPTCDGSGEGWDEFYREGDLRPRTASLRTVAHDSGDGETIFHCPFCGSGQVIGGADGTTSCDFCGTHFTVQVQPEFAAMPQTVDGTPYPMPGMPGSATDTAEGADAEDDVGAAQQDAQQQTPAPAQSAPPGPPQVDAQGQPLPPNVRQQLAASLTTEQFLARYALRHADDRDGVLRRVRALNAKES